MPYNSFSLNPAYALSPFCLKSPTFLPCHVLLDLQRGIATFQYDVAHTFPLFLPQITRFLAQPRRVGPPSRHRHLPIRRGSRFFALFDSKYSLPSRATSCWTSNATSPPPNMTWLTLFLSFCLKLPTS